MVPGSFLAAFAAIANAPHVAAQTGEGWITLLDESNMGEWNRVGETNWRMEGGAVVADNRTSEGPAYLVSPESYKDFQLYVEFWASDDANSGIFFRCSDPEQIGDISCYEANIYDQRSDPTYGTGGIVRHVEVDPMPRAGGKWNTYEITATGRDITVTLNGETTAELQRPSRGRALRAATRRRHHQVPQGRHQAAVGGAKDGAKGRRDWPAPRIIARAPSAPGWMGGRFRQLMALS